MSKYVQEMTASRLSMEPSVCYDVTSDAELNFLWKQRSPSV